MKPQQQKIRAALMHPNRLTSMEMLRAKRLRMMRNSIEDISSILGRDSNIIARTLRRELGDDLFHETMPISGPKGPPPEVLADRERRRAFSHATPTGHIMGDPEPGRSALDQRARA